MSLKAYEDACARAELFGQPMPDKDEFLATHKHLDVVEFEEIEIRTAENTAMLDDSLKGATGGIGELNTILASTQTKINKLKLQTVTYGLKSSSYLATRCLRELADLHGSDYPLAAQVLTSNTYVDDILTGANSLSGAMEGVCGSLTNFFRVKLTSSRDNLSYSSEPGYVGQTNYDKDSVPSTSAVAEGSMTQNLSPSELKKTPSPKRTRVGNSNQDGGDINSSLRDLEEMQKDDLTVLKSSVKDVGTKVTSQMSKLDQLISQADKAESSLHHQNKQMRSLLK